GPAGAARGIGAAATGAPTWPLPRTWPVAAQAIDNARLYRTAQEASRAKDEFLATVSHELRTPLTAIIGWTRVLRSRPADAATIGDALETIERNARAQAQIINDLLDVSRIITGMLRLNVRPIDLVA